MNATAWTSQMIISRIVIKGRGFCNCRSINGLGKGQAERSGMPFGGFFQQLPAVLHKSLSFPVVVPKE